MQQGSLRGPANRMETKTDRAPITGQAARLGRHGLCLALLALAACSGGPAGGPGESSSAPNSLTALAGDGEVTLSWHSVAGASSYTVYWAAAPGVTVASGHEVTGARSPTTHSGLTNGQTYSYLVTATVNGTESPGSSVAQSTPQVGASPYLPTWSNVAPAETLTFEHDGGLTDTQNGAALKAAITGLTPGQRLEIGTGTYSINSLTSINLIGTPSAPIWIAAKPAETPIITRPDAGQNALNVGSSGPARYLALQGLEITGGSAGVRLYDCQQVWIDRCHIHHTGDAGLTANTRDTANLHITRNEIDHTAGTGEGMYLGANNSVYVMRDSVIAQNHVHDCGGSQGDGIEIKQGSFGNWIVDNLVHDTNYPCILLYGTDGNAFNTVERNVCYNSNDNVIQVQGEALVRNNLIMNGGVGFGSHDHQGNVRDLTFVHNTVINSGRAVNLSDWSGRSGMTFANNAVYSQNSQSVRFANGSTGVEFVGNVVFGAVIGPASGFVLGAGLSDFANITWNATARDATPDASAALIAAGDIIWEVSNDLSGATRVLPLDSGCLDRP
ncbi:MAG: hypothetical protein ACI8QZ_003697 [Chlamydiales bacterium]